MRDVRSELLRTRSLELIFPLFPCRRSLQNQGASNGKQRVRSLINLLCRQMAYISQYLWTQLSILAPQNEIYRSLLVLSECYAVWYSAVSGGCESVEQIFSTLQRFQTLFESIPSDLRLKRAFSVRFQRFCKCSEALLLAQAGCLAEAQASADDVINVTRSLGHMYYDVQSISGPVVNLVRSGIRSPVTSRYLSSSSGSYAMQLSPILRVAGAA